MSDPQLPASRLCNVRLRWPTSGNDHPEPAFPLLPANPRSDFDFASSSFPFLVFSSLHLSLFSAYIVIYFFLSRVIPHYQLIDVIHHRSATSVQGLGLLVQPESDTPWGFY